MGERHIYIDEGPGEVRGVVTLDDRPERLLIERQGYDYPQLGVRYRARVIKVDRALGLARLDLGEGFGAALRLKPDRPAPTEGQSLEVDIAIEPQGPKAAVARLVQPTTGAPGRLGAPPSLADRLSGFAPGAAVTRGLQARSMADQAEDEAMAIEHPLPGGGSIALEPTRALTAVDIDLGAGVSRDGKRSVRQANLAAIDAVARLLRLRALGGLVVLDLVGRGHDGSSLARAAQVAFAPDQPGVIIGPITKFGTLELALPRRWRPIRDSLCDVSGRISDVTLALRTARAIEREGRADPGGRITARCGPEVGAALQAYVPALSGTLGARFEIISDPSLSRDETRVSVT
jgi:hypothetical protein